MVLHRAALPIERRVQDHDARRRSEHGDDQEQEVRATTILACARRVIRWRHAVFACRASNAQPSFCAHLHLASGTSEYILPAAEHGHHPVGGVAPGVPGGELHVVQAADQPFAARRALPAHTVHIVAFSAAAGGLVRGAHDLGVLGASRRGLDERGGRPGLRLARTSARRLVQIAALCALTLPEEIAKSARTASLAVGAAECIREVPCKTWRAFAAPEGGLVSSHSARVARRQPARCRGPTGNAGLAVATAACLSDSAGLAAEMQRKLGEAHAPVGDRHTDRSVLDTGAKEAAHEGERHLARGDILGGHRGSHGRQRPVRGRILEGDVHSSQSCEEVQALGASVLVAWDGARLATRRPLEGVPRGQQDRERGPLGEGARGGGDPAVPRVECSPIRGHSTTRPWDRRRINRGAT
mmetsp:Transcript_22110/g.75817  ORF Transcript_22110/g.75817 Transcript_22110/m.75817 type:complete len:413 (+) Transcript_22110:2131-3369(+)